jgi:hypothetical protein
LSDGDCDRRNLNRFLNKLIVAKRLALGVEFLSQYLLRKFADLLGKYRLPHARKVGLQFPFRQLSQPLAFHAKQIVVNLTPHLMSTC